MTGYHVLHATKPLISLGMATKPTASGHQKDNNSGQPLPPVPYPPDPGWQWKWFDAREAGWKPRRIPSRINSNGLTPRFMHTGVFGRALALAFPWVNRWDYPGQRSCLSHVLGKEIPKHRVWEWKKERCDVPVEVRDMLADWIEERGRALLEAATELRNAPRGPGKGKGRTVPVPRLMAERRAAEEAARERLLHPGPIAKANYPVAVEATGCRAFVEAALGRKLD